ncbi:MAG: DNA-directed RNA polymerase subunit B [Candidatus Woesearchaeota archaeon]
MSEVYIDHKYSGEVKNAQDFVENILSERRMGKISNHVNVVYDKNLDAVFVETSTGRVVRPLLVVKQAKTLLTQRHIDQLAAQELSWTDLVKQGIIEYLDATEEEGALIAFYESDLTAEHTHLEVAPMGIVGLTTSLVPFGQHNHGVRNAQGAKNQKQAVGFYAANFYTRNDMDLSLLYYPQVPIVGTLMHELSDYNKHPSGQNVTIAVLAYEGYNMEDALVINQGSVERGMGRSAYFRPVTSEELRYSGGLTDKITIPDEETKGFRTENDYRFLEDDGIVYPEAPVGEGDVVIGKTAPPRFLSALDEYNLETNSRRESSVSLKHGEQGVIDFVLLTENEEGNKLVQVRIRESRIPEIGDKFTSRHGQKGVIGMMVPEADVPFTASGIKPDVIFGPHGLPSRMTVSHIIEILGGKIGALSGRFIDSTLFESEQEENLREELANHGFRESGLETMYNAISGDIFMAKVMVGNMYYMRLKHMVANKLHSRARGPIQILTRQPTEGRAKEGGLRLGEMEKDTFVAHGSSLLLKERFDSDRTIVPVCERSGLIGYYDARKRKLMSPVYGEDSEVSYIEISYAFKLLLDEFKSLGIYPRIELEGKY